MTRAVTERDLRLPEYRDVSTEELEFRADGKLVRKDRWQTGIHSIRFAVGIGGREFEIQDVVARVQFVADIAANALEIIGDSIWADIQAGSLS